MSHLDASKVGWRALAPTLAFSILATAVVLLRFITRITVTRCHGLDDYIILPSMLSSWTITALTAAARNEGLGVHSGQIHSVHLAKLLTASNVAWCLCVDLTKISIICQYLRLFRGWTTHSMCVLALCFTVTTAVYSISGPIFLCRPVSKLWHPDEPGTCWSSEKYWLSVAGLNTAADVFVLVLPLPAISSLRLPRREKGALLLLFGLGFIVCIASGIRLAVVFALAEQGHHNAAALWNIILSATEANIGIICACSLAIKPLFILLWPHALGHDWKPRPAMEIPAIADAPIDSALTQPSGGSHSAKLIT